MAMLWWGSSSGPCFTWPKTYHICFLEKTFPDYGWVKLRIPNLQCIIVITSFLTINPQTLLALKEKERKIWLNENMYLIEAISEGFGRIFSGHMKLLLQDRNFLLAQIL